MGKITSFLAVTVLSIGARLPAENLVVNGSFEDGVGTYDGGNGVDFVTLKAGSTGITGWTIILSSIDYDGSYWQASDGGRSLDLEGAGGDLGGVSQTISTVPGKAYVLTFDMAGNPDPGAGVSPIKKMRVE